MNRPKHFSLPGRPAKFEKWFDRFVLVRMLKANDGAEDDMD